MRMITEALKTALSKALFTIRLPQESLANEMYVITAMSLNATRHERHRSNSHVKTLAMIDLNIYVDYKIPVPVFN